MKDVNELTEEQLKKVSGGILDPNIYGRCPKCGSLNIEKAHVVRALHVDFCECKDCGHKFYIEKDK